ncbi:MULTISPECIES: DUF6228 family protein [Streptomyces]|uniref:DUF6228 family protein n=1 Tax=Streptomyces TaxID=1883 RepID=UPI001F0DF7BC|nr:MULTISPECIES: DUF6228 family protein [Streptomyces]
MEEDETNPVVRVGGDRYRTISLRFHKLTRSFPEERDDLMHDFLVTAQGKSARIEVMVRTWDGDGLDVFLAELAEEFRGWNGTKIWRSLEDDLTLAAEHAGSHVRLTWGLHDRLPDHEWQEQGHRRTGRRLLGRDYFGATLTGAGAARREEPPPALQAFGQNCAM